MLPHRVKTRLVGNREVGKEVRECLRLLFRHRSLQKRSARVIGEGESVQQEPDFIAQTRGWSWKGRLFFPVAFSLSLINFPFPCVQWHSFKWRHWEGLIPILFAFLKQKNQLQVCELYPWARCMEEQQSLPNLCVFVDLDPVYFMCVQCFNATSCSVWCPGLRIWCSWIVVRVTATEVNDFFTPKGILRVIACQQNRIWYLEEENPVWIMNCAYTNGKSTLKTTQ